MKSDRDGDINSHGNTIPAARPPIFTTCPETLAADDWLRTIESKFTLLPELTEQEKLSHYAPEDVADDPRRAARLLHGFDPTLQTHLGRHYASFTDLVDTARDMENRLRVASEDQKRKRQANSAPASSSQKQKPTYQPPQYQRPHFVVWPNQPSWIQRAPQQQYPSYRSPAQLTAPRAPTIPGTENPSFNCRKLGLPRVSQDPRS
ncbi:hypothetical protein U9M48_036362 [Paspalum notatum var. saurae]|uniref:Uncharacterized protein n=1 Tax=Paspalum notatum var. saurae TaxID=547442 RepID=A0AAQ3UD16_PASNO